MKIEHTTLKSYFGYKTVILRIKTKFCVSSVSSHPNEGRKCLFNDTLNTSIKGYMASDIW